MCVAGASTDTNNSDGRTAQADKGRKITDNDAKQSEKDLRALRTSLNISLENFDVIEKVPKHSQTALSCSTEWGQCCTGRETQWR